MGHRTLKNILLKITVKPCFYSSIIFILLMVLLSAGNYCQAAPAARTTAKSPETAAKSNKNKRSPYPIRYLTENGRRYMNMRDVAAYYRLKFSFNKTGAVLYGGEKRVEFVYNKRAGKLNGVSVTFLFPMLIRRGNAYVSESDFLTILEPTLKEKVYRKHQLKNIMIDPGHGGTDPGAIGKIKQEKQVNLEVALKLKKALESLGFNVIMTRSNDKTISLQDRA